MPNNSNNSSKIIGINALFLIPNEVGGTEYHLRSFLQALSIIDSRNYYRIFCNKAASKTFSFKNENWEVVECDISGHNRLERIMFEQTLFVQLVKKYKCDLLHSFGYWGVLQLSIPQIITVHDVNWKDHPEDMGMATKLMTAFLTEISIKKAAAIMTDSEFGLSRLQHYFPNYQKKMKVISPGLDESFKSLLIKNSKDAKNIKKYVLCVSPFYPHKNMLYLLDLWSTISQTQKDVSLVIVGRRGLDEAAVRTSIKSLKNIEYYPKVSLEKLTQLYSSAEVFVFPSKYEGFGYPVYEATMSGAPVFVYKKNLYNSDIHQHLSELTTNIKHDAQRIISVLLSNKKHKIRTTLLNKYSYATAANELLSLYTKILK